jgi:peptide/nickel transport system permease protein
MIDSSTALQTTPDSSKARKGRWRRRFFRSPLAVLGFCIIGGFLLIVAFAPFLAPYNPASQNLRATYVPPLEVVRFRGPEGQLGVWVHPVSRSPIAGLQISEDELYPVRFFVRGQSWTWFFGLIQSDLRLFGVDGPIRFHLLGTD